jgi:hypothetical protein
MTPSDEAQEAAMVRNGGRKDVGEGENDGDGNCNGVRGKPKVLERYRVQNTEIPGASLRVQRLWVQKLRRRLYKGRRVGLLILYIIDDTHEGNGGQN